MSFADDFFFLLRKPAAWTPMLLALLSLVLFLGYVSVFGPDNGPDADEGLPAYTWQLMMLAQVLVGLYFFVRWVAVKPLPVITIISLQAALWLCALMTVVLVEKYA